MIRLWHSCLRASLYLLAVCALPAQAAPAPDEAATYERRINDIKANSQNWAKSLLAGKKAAFFCVNCHGEAGIGKLENVPNLAGQNPAYLMVQIQKFGDGRRQDDFMSGLIKALKEEERLNMAMYYASLDVTPGKANNARQVQQGKTLYGRACIGCHGVQARGGNNIARLAGQHRTYLIESLTRYRNRSGLRTDPVMSSVAAGLNDEQIAAVASYLTSLP